MAVLNRTEKVKEWLNKDKQRLITYLAYVLIVVVSILASTLSVVFGIGENFDGARFATNLCLNVAFAIIALILAWKDGELASDQRKSGLLYEMKEEFKKTVKLIIDTDGFRQWNDKLYEREKKDYIVTQLANAQIYDYEYILICEDDLKSLLESPRNDIQYFNKEKNKTETIALDEITEHQYEVIKFFKNGDFEFPKIPYTFFKSIDNTNSYKKYATEADKTRKIKVFTLVYRVVMIVIFSIIFALAIINPNQSDGKQVVFDTVSRIFNMVVSVFMGYSLARDEATRLRDSLGYKIGIINDYITDIETGAFVPLNRSEEINLKINERREKLKLEEAEKERKRIEMEEKKKLEDENEKIKISDVVETLTQESKKEEEKIIEIEIPEEEIEIIDDKK